MLLKFFYKLSGYKVIYKKAIFKGQVLIPESIPQYDTNTGSIPY